MLFPNIDHLPLPEKAFCSAELTDPALAQVRAGFEQLITDRDPADGVSLLLFESHSPVPQQKQQRRQQQPFQQHQQQQ